jgi:hypothetical protein
MCARFAPGLHHIIVRRSLIWRSKYRKTPHMPHSQANRLLNRINALHKSLQLDEGGSLSTMERDLMLGYLRELYEYYLNAAGQPATPPAPTPVPKPAPPKPVQAAPPPPPAPAPAPPKPKPAPTPPPAPVENKPKEEVPPPPKPAPAPPPPPATPTASKEIAALFSQGGGSHLAARLGSQSLDDLTKALSINSRLLYSKELFGDDNDLLNTTLRTLNSSGSLEAARPVLESLAKRFDWTLEERKETAMDFIELIRRRYA